MEKVRGGEMGKNNSLKEPSSPTPTVIDSYPAKGRKLIYKNEPWLDKRKRNRRSGQGRKRRGKAPMAFAQLF